MKFDVRQDDSVVSVCLITYNHAPYIRECLDSLLFQETNFPYEICVGEDESTDGTREICIKYAEKYPDRINLILRSQSEDGRDAYLSQGVYNYIETTKACSGKYLALCDGDDAWIDPLKLQKQFDVMEANPSVSLVHSNYDKIDEASGKRINNADKEDTAGLLDGSSRENFIYDLIMRRYPIAASTAFMKTADVLEIFEKNKEAFQTCPMGDVTTWCELVNYGSFYYQDEALGLYRILLESDSNSCSAEKKYKFVNGASNLGLMVGEKYNLPMEEARSWKIKNCNRYALLSGDFSEIEELRANKEYAFPLSEKMIFKACQSKFFRSIAKELFEFKYRINHRRFNTQ
ncbi:glycosyltransferase [Pontiella sulfatireligans]|uniref:Glycosyltransferase EpsE n=1 Tax=Pontiella sulfatireligans TaxID=2750658 RepID=A0A6C2UM03_9BACT|nr:glycosyltransferase [Pontiella sulfatireligans]VGO21292.1 Putative glycosyltransferase EpsE [Pontiella sulfatireligans]